MTKLTDATMFTTTDHGTTALVFRDVAHSQPTPAEFNAANHLGLTGLVIWVRDGTQERWRLRDGHWQPEETP